MMLATYHSNFRYSNFQQKISRYLDITSDYEFLLRLVNTFTIDTDEYYLMCYKVNDTKTFKNLAGLYFMLCAHKSSHIRLARLTGAFKIILI